MWYHKFKHKMLSSYRRCLSLALTSFPPPRCLSGRFLSDLHVYDPDSNVWSDLSDLSIGSRPSARSSHGLTAADGKLYVYGGYGQQGLQLHSSLFQSFISIHQNSISFVTASFDGQVL